MPINGKPLLEYWLDNLSKAGINEFLINTHYLHEQVEEFAHKSIYKDNITLVYEKNLLNTGGSLLKNKDFFENKPFMLVHADNLSFCSFKDFIYSHAKNNYEITMMLFKSDNPSSCGIVELDNKNIVKEFYEKVKSPPSNLANGAVYICEPSIFAFLKKLNKENIDFSLDVLPKFIGNINTYLNDTYHRDIGDIRSYDLAQIEILNI